MLMGFDLYAKYHKRLVPRIKDGLAFSGCPKIFVSMLPIVQKLELEYGVLRMCWGVR